MRGVGVVCEYNPFHRGHRYHLEAVRRRYPDAAIVCCMSGNWVQRGECAVADKWHRASWAVAGGADLVLDLPTPWAISSAEGFARGAVSLLTAFGIDALSFGCESDDLPGLTALAQALNSPEFSGALAPYLKKGLSFPAARQKAAADLAGPERASLLSSPNNALAVEYLRALPADFPVLPVKRLGLHDGPLAAGFPSAAALRQLLRRGYVREAEQLLPQPWEGEVHAMARGERAVLARLRTMELDELRALPDSSDGLAERLHAAARQSGSLPDLYVRTKSRQLTLSRVRRAVLWAFLGLTTGDIPPSPPYFRVLAMSPRGQRRLRERKGTDGGPPVITKPAQFQRELSPEARLTDLFGLFSPRVAPCGQEFTRSPVVISGVF